MKTYLLLFMLCAGFALQAQTPHSIATLQRKSNLKFTLGTAGKQFSQTPFFLNNRGFLGFEYERHLEGRHTLTVGVSAYHIRYPYTNGSFVSNVLYVDMGYRYYMLRWNGKRPFNGLYTGIGISSYFGKGKEIENGITKYRVSNNDIYPHLKIGAQTSFLRRFTLDVEGRYNLQSYSLIGYNRYFNRNSFSTTLRIGYTF